MYLPRTYDQIYGVPSMESVRARKKEEDKQPIQSAWRKGGYYDDPAQQWDDPDRMREDAERRFKARCEEAEAEKNND